MVNYEKLSQVLWDDIILTAVKEGKTKVDDVAKLYIQKVGTTPSVDTVARIQEAILKEMSVSGRLLSAGSNFASKTGTVAKTVATKTGAFAVAHPTITASIASAAAGGLLVAALQRQGAITEPADPYAFDVPYDPNNVVTNPGQVTTTQTDTSGNDKKDYGILGNALAWTGSTLFGQTGEEVGKFVDGAKPWVIGGGIIVTIVAIGYAANAFKTGKSLIPIYPSRIRY